MTKAIALFSGGLDSLLAARVVMEQGIEVLALQFITPFFNYKHKGREAEAAQEFRQKYGLDCAFSDVTDDYVRMLRKPRYGYGKNFNPCIDCKVFMMGRAKAAMEEMGADFIVSGEVIGQRPMSQRRDALRIVERDSGLDGYLVRPLCAKNMKPTIPEERGLIDRERLFGFSGRSRKPQMELAARMGITEYQTPAGGCLLTDPVISKRIESFVAENESFGAEELVILSTGRHFTLPSGRLYVGRNRDENEKLAALMRPGDLGLKALNRPGPLGLYRGAHDEESIRLAARVVARYADAAGLESVPVGVAPPGGEREPVEVAPADEALLAELRAKY